MEEDDLISVIDLARQLGRNPNALHKVVQRLGIEKHSRPGNGESRGQLVSYVTNSDAKRVEDDVRARDTDKAAKSNGGTTEPCSPSQKGVFYLLQLEPEHDPGRFKVGFATSLPERLRALRCSAPYLTVVNHWRCRFLWEKTAIECVTNGCEKLHTEVFRTDSIEAVMSRCDRFFELMPNI